MLKMFSKNSRQFVTSYTKRVSIPAFLPGADIRRRYDLVKERVLHSSSRGQKRMPKGQSMAFSYEGGGWIRTPKGEMAHSDALIQRGS